MQSSGQAAVAQRLKDAAPGTLRHEVLCAAQRFKSSWVELGALLVRVRNQNGWEEWGFASFEEYCAKELRIKRQTALKLTNSYSFLARHEKALSEVKSGEAPVREPPAFEVVSVLAGAEERGQLTEQDYRTLRDQIWDDDRPGPQVARDLAQRFPAPAKPPPPADLVLRRLASAARKLAQELGSCQKVPKPVAERAEALAEEVEELASAGK